MKFLQLFAEDAIPEQAQVTIGEETAQEEGSAAVSSDSPAEMPEADPMADAMTVLEKRYAVAPGDRAALARAITEENAHRTARRQALIEAGADRLYGQWMDSANQAKEMYPDFDLRTELKSPAFVRMLHSGVDVKTAYEVLHKDEIIPAAMQYAAKTVESRLASACASSALRPRENGVGGAGAVVIGSSVSSLSRRDIADIARRVERGERISFG